MQTETRVHTARKESRIENFNLKLPKTDRDFGSATTTYPIALTYIAHLEEIEYSINKKKFSKSCEGNVQTILKKMKKKEISFSAKTAEAVCRFARKFTFSAPVFIKKGDGSLSEAKIELENSVFIIPRKKTIVIYVSLNSKIQKDFEIFSGPSQRVMKAVRIIFEKKSRGREKALHISLTAKLSAKLNDPSKSLTFNQKSQESCHRRISIMQQLDAIPGSQQHFPENYDYIEYRNNPTKVLIFQELARGDFLDTINNDLDSFSRFNRLRICEDIILAIKYLHSKKIVHRDIKADNFLVFDSNEDSKPARAKLSDFGLACHFDDPDLSNRECGSFPWAAPELIKLTVLDAKPSVLNPAIDVYSAGVLIESLLDGKYPTCPKIISEWFKKKQAAMKTRSLIAEAEREQKWVDSEIRKIELEALCFQQKKLLELWQIALSKYPKPTSIVNTVSGLINSMQQPDPDLRISIQAASLVIRRLVNHYAKDQESTNGL